MLSRAADHLFWMARYIERAENTARLLDVSMQTTLLPQSSREIDGVWRAMLSISELEPQYRGRHGAVTPEAALNFMVCDLSNPASVCACLRSARDSARAVRGALTTEIWEIVNASWLEMHVLLDEDVPMREPARFFEWVKFRSHLARGAMLGTVLRDEGFLFNRLGTFLERADNTARILDVRYHDPGETDALGADEHPERPPDFYYWAAVLNCVSAFETYRRVYRDVITPLRVAELMILRRDMPRSLAYCLDKVVNNLEPLRREPSSETEVLAHALHGDVRVMRIDGVFETGLHTFLTDFLHRVNALGKAISRDFLVPPA